jgi:hypothetical protein
MTKHRTGTRKEWLAARLPLLEAEKELTRRGDEGVILGQGHPGGHPGVRSVLCIMAESRRLLTPGKGGIRLITFYRPDPISPSR